MQRLAFLPTGPLSSTNCGFVLAAPPLSRRCRPVKFLAKPCACAAPASQPNEPQQAVQRLVRFESNPWTVCGPDESSYSDHLPTAHPTATSRTSQYAAPFTAQNLACDIDPSALYAPYKTLEEQFMYALCDFDPSCDRTALTNVQKKKITKQKRMQMSVKDTAMAAFTGRDPSSAQEEDFRPEWVMDMDPSRANFEQMGPFVGKKMKARATAVTKDMDMSAFVGMDPSSSTEEYMPKGQPTWMMDMDPSCADEVLALKPKKMQGQIRMVSPAAVSRMSAYVGQDPSSMNQPEDIAVDGDPDWAVDMDPSHLDMMPVSGTKKMLQKQKQRPFGSKDITMAAHIGQDPSSASEDMLLSSRGVDVWLLDVDPSSDAKRYQGAVPLKKNRNQRMQTPESTMTAFVAQDPSSSSKLEPVLPKNIGNWFMDVDPSGASDVHLGIKKATMQGQGKRPISAADLRMTAFVGQDPSSDSSDEMLLSLLSGGEDVDPSYVQEVPTMPKRSTKAYKGQAQRPLTVGYLKMAAQVGQDPSSASEDELLATGKFPTVVERLPSSIIALMDITHRFFYKIVDPVTGMSCIVGETTTNASGRDEESQGRHLPVVEVKAVAFVPQEVAQRLELDPLNVPLVFKDMTIVAVDRMTMFKLETLVARQVPKSNMWSHFSKPKNVDSFVYEV